MTTLVRPRRRRAASWPLDAPGMPPPGPDFLAAAAVLGDQQTRAPKKRSKTATPVVIGGVLQGLYDRALRTPGLKIPIRVRGGQKVLTPFIPGHIWAQHRAEFAAALVDTRSYVPPVDGPAPAPVLVLGKMPWREESVFYRNLIGPSGEELVAALDRVHITGADKWYVTNLVKFVPPDGGKRLSADWIADCLPLLHMELRLVRPRAILCLGADAAKALLGKSATIRDLDGRVVPFRFPIHHNGEEPRWHECSIVTVVHPAQVAADESLQRTLDRGLGRFSAVLRGQRFDSDERDIDHRVVRTMADAQAWAAEATQYLKRLPPAQRLVGWDAEWHGRNPHDPKGYLRTVQCSWADKKAVVFTLRDETGRWAFRDQNNKPAAGKLWNLLDEFCRASGARAVGHFLLSDLEWFDSVGFDPTAYCPIPLHDAGAVAPWERLRNGEGWLDTGLMAHAIEETALLGLEALTVRYTGVPRYDLLLEQWKTEFCAAQKIKKEQLNGFGRCPDKILVGEELDTQVPWGRQLRNSYAGYDADATRRLATALLPLLTKDYHGLNCWEPFWESMITQPVIREMRRNGVAVDRQRMLQFTQAFVDARDRQEAKVRDMARWPNMNLRSLYHVREFLFGPEYNGHEWVGGRPVRLRPPGAVTLRLQPLVDTSKPPVVWERVVAEKRERQVNPSTSKSTLAILAVENLEKSGPVSAVMDHRFLDQVCKGVLRPPLSDDSGYVEDDDGEMIFDGGLFAAIDRDGRVRTRMAPTAETGRWKSWDPALQNISKTRDKDYRRLLGDAYKQHLRSIFVASEGHALIEFDYKGAELAVVAFMSGDTNMIDHVRRANLKESDPNYYDIHSNVAVLAFRLGDKAKPTKSALEEAGLGHFRTLAKNVIFGLLYGRSARAIALQARENRRPGDPEVTEEQAQAVVDAIMAMYPGLEEFMQQARVRATKQRWITHCFGRHRRVPTARDRLTAGEFERQFLNFPIQGGVASAVDRGLANLQYLRDQLQRPDLFRMLLQMHDAGLVEAPYEHVAYVANELIPAAMVAAVPIYPSDFNGRLTGAGPYYLGIDVSVMPRWGEKYSYEDALRLGIPTEFAAKPKAA